MRMRAHRSRCPQSFVTATASSRDQRLKRRATAMSYSPLLVALSMITYLDRVASRSRGRGMQDES